MTGKPYPQLASALQMLLDRLRRRIRRYVWIEGLAAVLVWMGMTFWASLIVDWFFEPPPAVRMVILAVVGLGLAGLVYQLIVRRLLVPLSDASMALLLERRYPQFNETLLTAVELTALGPDKGECNPDMLARTCHLATESARDVQLQTVFNPVPLRRNVAVALVLAVAIGGFALQSPQALGVWARRNLLFSQELWPRNTRLSIDGFNGGVVKVARGADLTIVARADLAMPQVPNVVDVRYRTEDGARLHARMVREGAADPRKDKFQEYSHTFTGILTPIQFDLLGGDDAVRNLRIQVVDSPATTDMVLDCRYPAYTGRSQRTLPVTGVMQIPMGSEVTIRATANKDLQHVEVESALNDGNTPAERIEPLPGADRRHFQLRLPKFTADTTLLFTLFDTDGIKSREPVRLAMAAVADEKPEMNVHLRGIGSAITNQARIPAVGRISDDYGLARLWFDYTIDQKTSGTGPIRTLAGNTTELESSETLEVQSLNLKPGQKLLVSLKAADRCDLTAEPNVGSSERWLLDVVTPEQLRTILEARELVLRQRFETIVQDVTETRDLLARMEFQAQTKPAAQEKPEASKPAAGKEPGEDAAKPSESSPERLMALRTMRVERALQNSQKDAQEILGVAESFSDIREELINNRIDTEELKQRLQNGIANPLRQIVGEMFPEFDRRLNRLQTTLADERVSPANLAQVTQQLDMIQAAMRRVLDRMIELEDFNEAVELLRDIVEAQQQLHDQTKQRQKQKLRDLLE
jgi:hypothetical protein